MYIQHPSEIPVVLSPLGEHPRNDQADKPTDNGITFSHHSWITPGVTIDICITLRDHQRHLRGHVDRCEMENDHFRIAVCFSAEVWYAARLIEQACQIDSYHRQQQSQQGCRISRHQSAMDWISRHAERFPQAN